MTPDAAAFPRVKLLLILVLPALPSAFAWIAEKGGHKWNVHGDMLLVIQITILLLVLSFLASIFMLSFLIPALRQHPTLRTGGNLVCTGLSLTFVAAVTALLIFIFLRMVS